MRYYLLFAITCISIASPAQDCSPEQLAKKQGDWKAGMQGSVSNISAADLTREKSVIAGIDKMMKTNYYPAGCQANFSSAFGKYPNAGQSWIADPYMYSLYVLPYLCDPKAADKSRYYVAIATATTLNICANEIFSLNNLYAASLPPDDSRGYLKLVKRPAVKNGYYFMGEEVSGDGDQQNKIIEYRWLITYNDTLPFSYLSRKEYLLIQKKRLELSIKESPGEKDYNEKFLRNISSYLNNSEDVLSQPAICMWNEEERFEKFVGEGTRGSFMAVKPNLLYYRKNLPKSSPQFFSVVYKVSKGFPVLEDNMAAIEKAVDFAALRSMLGK
jgi:hypothetical protein